MNHSSSVTYQRKTEQRAVTKPRRASSCQTLSAALRQADSPAELCDAAVAAMVVELNAEFVCLSVRCGDEQYESTAGDREWIPLGQGLSLRMNDARRPVLRLLDDAGRRRCAAIALPVDMGGSETGQSGTVVAIVESESLAEARGQLQQLTAQTQLLSVALERIHDQISRQADAGRQLQTLSKSISYSSVDQFCYAIANGLRVEADADLVAVGLVDRLSVRLSCVSGLDETKHQSPGSRMIRQSMEEALDAQRPVCVRSRESESEQQLSGEWPLTARWQQLAGDADVASIPLMTSSGDCVAVISVQSRQRQPLSDHQIRKMSDLTTPMAASLDLMKSGQRSLLRHACDSAGSLAAKVCGPLSIPAAAVLIVVIALASWMVLGTTSYMVRTPCTVIAARTQILSTPWETPLEAVFVRPGQLVEEGQLLARMQTDQLLAEKSRVVAELRAAQIEVATAAAEAEPAEIGRAVSRRRMAEADLARIDLQLGSAEIRAPFRGQIISEDLVDRTGETIPMGEPLFEIVPEGSLALAVELPESVLSCVVDGQGGSFAMNASPGTSHACRLERIEPAAEAGATGNVVHAEASIQEVSSWLRPGMQGVVQINTGERAVWWVWLHSAIDAVNYEVWALSGTASEAVSNERIAGGTPLQGHGSTKTRKRASWEPWKTHHLTGCIRPILPATNCTVAWQIWKPFGDPIWK